MTSSFLVFQNGKRVSGDFFLERLVSISKKEKSFAPEIFDLGIFEGLKAVDRKIQFEAEHLARLLQSAKTAGFVFDLNIQKIRKEIRGAFKTFCRQRPACGHGPVFIRLSLWGRNVFVMIGNRSHRPALYRKGVRLQTSPVLRTHPNASAAEVKTSAYLNSVMSFMEPAAPGIYEKIFLDTGGYVTESCVGNLFAVRGGKLFTSETHGILNGVTRRFVIKCARRTGIETTECPLTRHDLFNADEVFLTNASWEILPVAELDGRRIGRRVPGPVTSKLQRIFKPYANAKEPCL